jgi:6-phosphogluconolactonase
MTSNQFRNSDGSTVSLHPRSVKDGTIGEAFQVFKYNLTQPGPGWNESQIQADPHQAIFEPSGKFMFVPDRGADFIYGYQVPSDHSGVRQVANITLPLGTGARHIGFKINDDSSTLMYVVSELDNTIRVFRLDGVDNTHTETASHDSAPQTLQITLLQVASTLGPGNDRTAPQNIDMASEFAISDDGRFVYVANRNTRSENSDTIAVFATADPVAGAGAEPPLTYLGQNATHGKIPRHFSLSNDAGNLYVAVANEVSNNVLIFKRDAQTGFLEEGILGNLTLGVFDVDLVTGPMAVVWA